MTSLTETVAELLVAEQALRPGRPGFTGLTVDLPGPAGGPLPERVRLRHGFLDARAPGVAVVSGPPSPGIEASIDRMTEDLAMAVPLVSGTFVHDIARGSGPVGGGPGGHLPLHGDPVIGGVRVALEAGVEGNGPFGMRRRWHLAQAIAPVLAAAFANAPLRHGRPSGWRSTRLAQRRDRPPVPAGLDPGRAWAALVLDAPVAGSGRTLRAWLRSGPGDRPSVADLDRHLAGLRPPVAARGHLEMDGADRQPGRGWRVPLAVTAALLDDPQAAATAEAATRDLAGTPLLGERVARDALTDPALAAAARECFVAAYASLARHGVARDLRDAVAEHTERYVLRGRCPADDILDRVAARP